ncbi:MAG: hypothetical protein Q4E68_13105, partial [Prevotellaceae bacterium]|nr:hypothetical protein [Prevotellaceae bacterium]
ESVKGKEGKVESVKGKVESQESKVIIPNSKWTLHFIEEAPEVNESFTLDRLCTWENLNEKTKVTMGTGVYETTFDLPNDESQEGGQEGKVESVKGKESKEESKRWVIDLGDVRESARVYINDEYVGCAWCVPYILTFRSSILKPTDNKLRIEVTNLPANRIADMDKRKIPWRKFEDINIVDINYKYRQYGRWKPMESGLKGPVKIYW